MGLGLLLLARFAAGQTTERQAESLVRLAMGLAALGRWCMNRRIETIRGPGPVGARWATISA